MARKKMLNFYSQKNHAEKPHTDAMQIRKKAVQILVEAIICNPQARVNEKQIEQKAKNPD